MVDVRWWSTLFETLIFEGLRDISEVDDYKFNYNRESFTWNSAVEKSKEIIDFDDEELLSELKI